MELLDLSNGIRLKLCDMELLDLPNGIRLKLCDMFGCTDDTPCMLLVS